MDAKEEKQAEQYLVFITRQTGVQLEGTKMPIGSMMQIHESDDKTTAPMIILKVTMKAIDLACGCSNPKCNLRLRLRIERAGAHPLVSR